MYKSVNIQIPNLNGHNCRACSKYCFSIPIGSSILRIMTITSLIRGFSWSSQWGFKPQCVVNGFLRVGLSPLSKDGGGVTR